MKKKVAVIILNWNGIELLKQFLPKAVEDTIDDYADLIVADNGSTDGSVEWIAEHCPQVMVLRFDTNLGFAGGYNEAIRLTDYQYTLLLNSDVETTRGWVRPLLRFMELNRDAGACQPKIRSWKQREMFEYAGAAGGYLDKHGYPYCRGRLFASIEKDEGQYDLPEVVPVAWASGAALMVRTQAYWDAGGLDTDFFAHMEEIDLCCRMQRYGYGVYAVSSSMVFHVGGASLNQGNPRKTYLNFRNNLLLLYKNSPRQVGRRLLFVRRLLDTLAWTMYMVKFDFANANAILKAHRDFRKMRGEYTAMLPKKEYLSTLPGAHRDIITDYYLKRQKI